jgi:hypothetical protein
MILAATGQATVNPKKGPKSKRAPVTAAELLRIHGATWETIADKLSKAGWSLGWVSAVDSEGRTIWIVDAHRDNGKRFVVRSDERLAAFLELERITHQLAVSVLRGDDIH